MIAEIRSDCQFTPIQRGVAHAVNSFIGENLERDEVSSRRADEYFCILDLHKVSLRTTHECTQTSDPAHEASLRRFVVPH